MSELSESTPIQTPNQQSMQAIETCFALIANASFPISKHEDVKAALSFLDALHAQLKQEEPVAESISPEAESPVSDV